MLWTSAQVARTRPRVVAARTACDVTSVDAYLEEIASALRQWEDGTRAAGTSLRAADLWEASFPTTLTPGQEGYDQQSVTALLRSFSRTLRAYEARFPISSAPPDPDGDLRPGVRVTSQEVAGRTFIPVRFISGYHRKDVDDFLDDIAWTLAGYEKWSRPAPPRGDKEQTCAPISSSEVARHSFAVVRLHEGYRPDEVDAFMSRIVATLQDCESEGALTTASPSTRVSPADIETVTFRTTMLRRGYNEEEVDSLLDHVAATLRAYSGGQQTAPR